MTFSRSLLIAALSLSPTWAAPLSRRDSTAPVSVMSSAQVSALTPFARMAAVSYCSVSSIMSWSCGPQCSALSGMVPLTAGGDDADIPDYYVGYYPAANAAVVSHQGTNPSSLGSWVDDLSFAQEAIDPNYFPGLSGVEVHSGFQSTFETTAATILSAVRTAISSHGATQVYVVGHSLGAAIALFDALYIHEQVSLPMTVRLFGLPRVGNQAFADLVDSRLSGLLHVVDDNDIVPHVPPEDFGFIHPSGEVWITTVGGSTYDLCPGQENDNCANSVSVFDYEVSPHDGPYAGITMGSSGAGCT